MSPAWWVAGLALAAAPDGTEISRSRGARDGVVVLFPRLVPPTEDPVLLALARTIEETIAGAFSARRPGSEVDTRPSPERVCPLVGCRAMSVGLVIGHDGGGCVALAVVGPPGPSAQLLVPLAGTVDVPEPSMPFRTAPEERFVARELVPCSEIPERLDLVALLAAATAP